MKSDESTKILVLDELGVIVLENYIFDLNYLFKINRLDYNQIKLLLQLRFPLYNLNKKRISSLLKKMDYNKEKYNSIMIPIELLGLALLNRIDLHLKRPEIDGIFKTKYLYGLTNFGTRRTASGLKFLKQKKYIQYAAGRKWFRTNKSFDELDFILESALLAHEKYCSKCKQVKNKTDFKRNNYMNNGLHRWCKDCEYRYNQRPDVKAKIQAYQQRPDVKAKRREYEQRPDVKAKRREYEQRPDVKAKRRERAKKYYQKNKEQILKRNKKYYQKNKEQILARIKENYRKKPEVKEKHKEYSREYYQKNKEQILARIKENYRKRKVKVKEI